MQITANVYHKKGIDYQENILTLKPTEYCKVLAEEADIDNVSYVLLAIKNDSDRTHIEEQFEFRKYRYIIIDDKTFIKEKCDGTNCVGCSL